jgi:diguanylate cyclase (GGDEF)-like protein
VRLSTKPNLHLTPAERRSLVLPAAYIILLVEGISLVQVIVSQDSTSERLNALWIGGGVLIYTWLLFRFEYALFDKYPFLYWLTSLVNGVAVVLLAGAPLSFAPITVTVLIVLLIVITAIIAGRWPAYIFILSAFASGMAFGYLNTPQDPLGWAGLFSLLLVTLPITEMILRLGETINAKVIRLETIRQVSRKIASTIEVDQVISLVCAAVQEAMLADTYFVGLKKGDRIHLELFYDHGEFFPPTEVSIKDSLAGWVVENRRSLLLGNLPVQVEKLGLKSVTIGQPYTSQSWIGAPMIAGNHILGILAVASYQRYAFDEGDLELLESLAHQAALVIDNANHHAEVEEQSRLDSLTQVYNHKHFLLLLDERIQRARSVNSPLSMIMLDIDHFKDYNDQYGHLVGDQALVQVVEAVCRNVRSSDVVGRWGGEEFAVILTDTSSQQALEIAERIRKSLRELALESPDGVTLPAPTVSQGIAVFPDEEEDAEALVHRADQRLYQAKSRGRDQVEPALDPRARQGRSKNGLKSLTD